MKNLFPYLRKLCSKANLFPTGMAIMLLSSFALTYYDLNHHLGIFHGVLLTWATCRTVSTAIYGCWFFYHFDPKIKSFPLKILCQYAICEIPAITFALFLFFAVVPDKVTPTYSLLLFLVDFGIFLMTAPSFPRRE